MKVSEQTFQPEHFINRELSWLEFNARVIEEALDPTLPLLERVKFLAIFSSNLDEFFMIRVAGLREQAYGDGAPQDHSPDGLRAITQLERISRRAKQLVEEQCRAWSDLVRPELAREGIRILSHDELDAGQRDVLARFFRERALPILTPMAIDPSHPTPRFHNRGLYLAATLRRHSGLGPRELFAVVQLPRVLPRLVPLAGGDACDFILLEEAVAARIPELFGQVETVHWTTFRITRDADIELLEQEADDMLGLIEQRIRARERGQAVRLEVAQGANRALVHRLIEDEELVETPAGDPESYGEVYETPGPIDFTFLWELTQVSGHDQLRQKAFTPRPPRGLEGKAGRDLFRAIRKRDILLHHPFDSFDSVVNFVNQAAADPSVLAIKQTLYRTSGDSPIVRALMSAAENGKQVTALVELKARFDEANNVSWARQLERAGVHVVFGFMDLKTHCKMSLVVRQEGDELRRYVHLSTGNYNPTTAALYTDIGLFTADQALGEDATALFNLLTGYSQGHRWHKMVVAPTDLSRRTVELIDEQARRARQGQPTRIFAKLNALVDHRTIEALYRASQAGVPIDILARGICCLRPGIEGVSENIRVRSVVDRFLEHSRIFVFGPDDDAEVFLSSADWMPRNFYRRVEVMFPVEDPALKDRILHEILPCYLRDNVKTRELLPDGSYRRVPAPDGQPPFRAQEELIRLRPGQPPTSLRTRAS